MKSMRYGLILFFVLGAAGIGRAETCLSPSQIGYSPSESKLYVVESSADRVDVLEPESRQILLSISFDSAPSGIALAGDGNRLYVSTDTAVTFYNLQDEKITASVFTGLGAMSPVLSPDGGTLYVCNRFDNSVSMIDIDRAAVTKTISVVREPVTAVLSPDAALLLVGNHLPAGAADADYVGACVSIIDAKAGTALKTLPLPNGSTGIRGICISPDGHYAYVTHILAKYQLPTTQLDRGWMNTNALSIIDLSTQSLYATFLLDDVDHGAANPWAVACSPDGARLYVTHAGTHELSVIDRPGLHQKLAALAAGKKVSNVIDSFEAVSQDLSFLGNLRQRIHLDGQGPRSLAVTDKQVFVGLYFSDAVVTLDANGQSPTLTTLNPNAVTTPERRGEALFNDAALCFQQWQSCASCHPDGRADGLNWDLLNDGIGNPKNTKSLLLSHRTPPVMATGIRDSAETAVRAGIRYIQFAQRPEADAAAIDAYLKSLQPEPSPQLVDGALSPSAQAGKKVFESAGCANCHSTDLFTDQQKYDVGTGLGREASTVFDTPTLIEVWRTAPYLNRGQAETMRQVLIAHNHDNRHGKTSTLTDAEMQQLIDYLLSL